nr:hypothetical protein [Chloroflexota bacterium]
EGYGASDGGLVRTAAERGTVIPLEGLGGLFPTTRDRFNLAYAESVSAVSFFIETYGEERLVSLIRSYGGGVTDDQAFTTATGADLAAFDDSWLSSLGAQVPDPFGPQPAPPGPLPPGWTGASDPVLAPTRSSAPSAPGPGDPSPGGATDAPAPHAPSQGAGGDSMDGTLLLAAGAVGSVLVGILIVGAVVIARRRSEA